MQLKLVVGLHLQLEIGLTLEIDWRYADRQGNSFLTRSESSVSDDDGHLERLNFRSVLYRPLFPRDRVERCSCPDHYPLFEILVN